MVHMKTSGISMDKLDKQFMKKALEKSYLALRKNEVPVGSVLVYDNKIISASYNKVEELQDATAHAEMLCLKEAYKILGNWRLKDTTIYSTLEPCCMCMASIILSRVKRVVWGADDIRLGGGGTVIDLVEKLKHIHDIEITCGVLSEESSKTLKEFFKKVRFRKTI